MIKSIFIYSDSISWGIIPGSRNRFKFHERWPGKFELLLNQANKNVRVVEDCLNGRRTMYEDPIRDGRDGTLGLAQKIEIFSPLDLIMILLGTNDFQFNHQHTPADAVIGLGKIIDIINTAPVEPGMKIPPILMIAPPLVIEPKGDIAEKFKNCRQKIQGLSEAIQKLAKQKNVFFYDANFSTPPSLKDGVHLDLDQHQKLANDLTHFVLEKELI